MSIINLKTVKSLLRNNNGRRYRGIIIQAFIVGSVAKGTAKPESDLDIALVIPAIRGKNSLRYSEEFHQRYRNDFCYPKHAGRKVDFQFFYVGNKELADYSKIEIK